MISVPPPRLSPKGADHHRLGRELDGLGHALELADGEIDLVPLFFLNRHEQQHHIGADRKIVGVIGDHESVESIARTVRFQGLTDETDNVAAERVHLGMKFDAGDAIAQIDQRRARIFLDHAIGFFCHLDRPDALRNLNRSYFALLRSK